MATDTLTREGVRANASPFGRPLGVCPPLCKLHGDFGTITQREIPVKGLFSIEPSMVFDGSAADQDLLVGEQTLL